MPVPGQAAGRLCPTHYQNLLVKIPFLPLPSARTEISRKAALLPLYPYLSAGPMEEIAA